MRIGFTYLAVSLLSVWLGQAAAAAERPNIVVIFTDDLGINDLACYGRQDQATPRLDALAGEGIRFTSAYCAQPICSPSRAAILTGKHPARLHITTYLPGRPDARSQKLLHPKIQMQLPLEEKTLAEYLKEANRRTMIFAMSIRDMLAFTVDKSSLLMYPFARASLT